MEKPSDGKVATFDPSKRKPGGISVDLNAPFFTRRRDPPLDYSKCDHTRLGFEYDVKHRKVYCRCGEEVDSFDAIVALANAERRLQETRKVIEAEAHRKAEEKAKKPFAMKTCGYGHNYDSKGRAVSRTYRLECGHDVTQHRGRGFKRYWRSATCDKCYRAAELAKQGIATITPDPPDSTKEGS